MPVVDPSDPSTWPLATVAKTGEDYSEYVMICLKPSQALREIYVAMSECTEDVDELHITLWYGGKIGEDLSGDLMERERVYRACYGAAIDPRNRPLEGRINGFGWFLNDDEQVLVALWDLPYLNQFRTRLLDHLELHGVPLREENHGFTPHMTLAYGQTNHTIPRVPEGGGEPEKFGSLWLVWGEEWHEISLV